MISTASASTGGDRKRKADDIEDENEGVGGWVYVGSHNLSPAAWVSSLIPAVTSTADGTRVRST